MLENLPKEDLMEVVNSETTYDKGVRFTEDGVEFSFSLNESFDDDEYEAYITADSINLDKAVEKLEAIRDELAKENEKDKQAHKVVENSWAEIRFKLNAEALRNL